MVCGGYPPETSQCYSYGLGSGAWADAGQMLEARAWPQAAPIEGGSRWLISGGDNGVSKGILSDLGQSQSKEPCISLALWTPQRFGLERTARFQRVPACPWP